ncbi:MFS transporter [Pseudaestuariivita atlantica]|uniref:Sugar:cation symporter n=1 Tax=Pseudaestuariivita atlantica TaxID=1317121 RepID=A0A0L1JSH2_9RHOB|nr:MFS transporter [Pseudaestuariivita atlantica]KNG94734.1 sugar:cation symporter [Pseudaestuariivita atlantica]
MSRPQPRLWAFALFGGLLSAAGLPLYIHAPKFYVDAYGVSLGALGAVLFGLRLLDFVQDPLLGRLSDAVSDRRGAAVALALVAIGGAMVGLFAVTPPIAPIWWFAAMLTLVFSAFSFLTITFYAQGVTTAARLPGSGHLLLARWREAGALVGVCIAAVAPVALAFTGAPFAAFAVLFAACALLAGLAMQGEWTGRVGVGQGPGFLTVLGDPLARRLLLIALLNAAPVAVSSTVFLFFVESRLGAPGAEGPLLLLFFAAAAASAPVWSRLAERYGPKPVLLSAMVLAIISFGGALTLGTGDVWLFALICLASGATVGADLTLLPALFATRMGRIAPDAAQGFGLWSFVSKAALAVAAVILLPALEAAGFKAGTVNSEEALWVLTWFYAGLPCLLKLVAIGLLAATDLKEL